MVILHVGNASNAYVTRELGNMKICHLFIFSYFFPKVMNNNVYFNLLCILLYYFHVFYFPVSTIIWKHSRTLYLELSSYRFFLIHKEIYIALRFTLTKFASMIGVGRNVTSFHLKLTQVKKKLHTMRAKKKKKTLFYVTMFFLFLSTR